MEPDERKFAFDLVLKAYEHHKTHARFAETQRSWMVAAYFTLTGFVYVGILSTVGKLDKDTLLLLPNYYSELLMVALLAHFVLGIFFMLIISKLSGVFTRYFSRAEKIVSDVTRLFNSDEFVRQALANVPLETVRTIAQKRRGVKGTFVTLFSSAYLHAYIFSLLTSVDIYLICFGAFKFCSLVAFAVALLWFIAASFAQCKYAASVGKDYLPTNQELTAAK